MKKLIAAALVLGSLNSFAAKLTIFETNNYSQQNVDASYGINEEMGRGWVELAIQTGYSGDDSGPDYQKVAVPGMSLVGDSVVLNVEGQQVECAHVRPVGIFRYRVAKPTGKCQIRTHVEKRRYDDGFETHKVETLVVTLETLPQ